MGKTLDVVVGAQFGSEAKGHVAKRLLERVVKGCTCGGRAINVRVAGPNAGHTVYDEQGTKFALRSIPVGVVIPSVTLYIAPGSEIDLDVLLAEIDYAVANGHRIRNRLFVSGEATMLYDQYKDQESFASGLDLVAKIGSTGKGIGVARSERILRSAKRLIDDDVACDILDQRGVTILQDPWKQGPNDHVVIEGTQGYGLGLHAGFYPKCTSSDARAIDFCAMAGMNPWDYDAFGVWAVARPFPIRVAGNSGPLHEETTWEDLGLEPELTTVTQKVRRVGHFDPWLVAEAIKANGIDCTKLVITMIDQVDPNIQGYSTLENRDHPDRAFINSRGYARLIEIQQEVGARLGVLPTIPLVTTGPDTGVWFE